VSKNVPFDVAFLMDDDKRIAFCLILKEQELGAKYNFNTKQFDFPKK
jgi:hypothetical protein